MDVFTVKSSVDDSIIEFSDRLPDDRSVPIDSFLVRISRIDLVAAARVWASYAGSHPAKWFLELAENWRGWQDKRQWESLENELHLAAIHDRRGHIAIRIQLQSGCWKDDWHVAATVKVDAGQLDGFAKHAMAFFGKEGRYQ